MGLPYDYKVLIDQPDAATPVECDGCGWTGTFAECAEIEDCMLTPGDPSPAGRCSNPNCNSLVYVVKRRDNSERDG